MSAQRAPHTPPLWRRVLSLPQTRLGWWEPWRRTRPQGLCQVSTFYTTLVKKSQVEKGGAARAGRVGSRIPSWMEGANE
jgi:hypothetical protein